MPKVKYIPCDIYKRSIGVFVGTLAEFKQYVKKEYDGEDEKDFAEMVESLEDDKIGMASFNYDYSNGTGIVLIPCHPNDAKYVAALAHEMLHATFFLLDFCRVHFHEGENNEEFTYVLEHLMRNALEFEGYEEVCI